jgi:DNA-binding NarL/FixJ family response regulator
MRALLIDDHALFCDAMALLFDARFPGIALHQSHDLADGLEVLNRESDIRLVLVDLDLPDSSGPESLPALKACAPAARLVVVSADDRPDTVERAIDLGASGFVPKTAQSDVLARALHTILEGGVFIPPPRQSAQRHASPIQHTTPVAPAQDLLPDRQETLSVRQLQVLQLLIEGQSNKHICRALSLSESTVKTHINAIFQRLQVSNRTQAVMAAARLGLRFSL